MRIIEVKLFKYDELSDKAKENALRWYANGYEYFNGEEAVDTLKAFVDFFSGKINDYSLDYNGGQSFLRFSLPESAQTLKGVRLWKWLVNNPETKEKLLGDCGLTGVCFDYTITGPVRDFLKKPSEDVTIEDLIKDGFHDLAHCVADDYEYQCFGDGAIESIRANEYEFLENGDHA